jgi:hypothetical protein
MNAFLKIILLMMILSVTNYCKAQGSDTASNKFFDKKDLSAVKDTVLAITDSTIKKMNQELANINERFKNELKNSGSSMVQEFKNIQKPKSDSVLKSLLPPNRFNKVFLENPFLKFNGGFISYNMNYRSNIDTPFTEQNILQHNAYGNVNISVANIPLRVNYLLRRSNSNIFQDINDIQVEFDAMQFGNTVRAKLKEKLLASMPAVKDTLLAENYKAILEKFKSFDNWFINPDILQKLTESNEILNVPGITYDGNLTDTVNTLRSDQLKKSALLFIEEYNKRKVELERLKKIADSLEHLYNKMYAKVQAYKNLVDKKLNGTNSAEGLLQDLKGFGINNISVPKRYQWLLNIRKAGLGRNQLNYSELTSKNMSLTGINFEYNSWYYLAFAAGKIDYRFRDFIINNNNIRPQYMYMVRLGIGKLEGNHLIFSFYKGQKQLFAATNNSAAAGVINIAGLAAEAKYKINRNSYIIAEVAESLSPDFRNTPATKTKFDLQDNSNKALAVKFYSYIPATFTHLEGTYKYSGANFQSFSSFQTNSSLKSWHIKADQQFLKRKLKLAVALRSNEFSNPYIIQNYKSNTIFKSIQATYRAKRMPAVTIGYQPTSQITAIDSQFVENQFYSFNAGLTHSYKIGERRASSVLVYNRFYNNESDTSYLYYNASNIFFNQTILFNLYTMNMSLAHSKSTSFELNILDAGFQFKFSKIGSLGFGVKINDFDRTISETGAYGTIQLNLKKLGVINMVYDNGFIPGSNHRFIKNKMMNLNFTRAF